MKCFWLFLMPISFAISGCKPAEEQLDQEDLELSSLSSHGTVESELWAVTPGDTWEYAVIYEFAPGMEVPERLMADHTRRDANGVTIEEFTERETYKGRAKIGASERTVDIFETFRNEELLEEKYLEISNSAVAIRGSRTFFPTLKPATILEERLVLVRADFLGGEVWQINIGKGEQKSTMSVKVGGREAVEVPAGEFMAQRIQIAVAGRTKTLQTYWFVERLGIVKDTKETYLNGKLLFERTRSLTGARVATYRGSE